MPHRRYPCPATVKQSKCFVGSDIGKTTTKNLKEHTWRPKLVFCRVLRPCVLLKLVYCKSCETLLFFRGMYGAALHMMAGLHVLNLWSVFLFPLCFLIFIGFFIGVVSLRVLLCFTGPLSVMVYVR